MNTVCKKIVCLIIWLMLLLTMAACNQADGRPDKTAFHKFKIGITTREEVISAVGECDEYHPSFPNKELYHTSDGNCVWVRYNSEGVVAEITFRVDPRYLSQYVIA